MTDPGHQAPREQTTAEKVIDRLTNQVGQLTTQLALRDVLLEEARTEIQRLTEAAPALPDDSDG